MANYVLWPRWAPCWPHELCYLGVCSFIVPYDLMWYNLCYLYDWKHFVLNVNLADIRIIKVNLVGTRGWVLWRWGDVAAPDQLYHPFYNRGKGTIMSVMAIQITSLSIVYSTVYSDVDQRKHQSSASLAFWGGRGNSPVTSVFPAQRTSDALNISIWFRHHMRSTFHNHLTF